MFCRCTLPQLNLLNFEVSPVIDLRVTPTTEDCMVELLCCKVTNARKLVLETDTIWNDNTIIKVSIHFFYLYIFCSLRVLKSWHNKMSIFQVFAQTWCNFDNDVVNFVEFVYIQLLTTWNIHESWVMTNANIGYFDQFACNN